jgi:mono/diheme cytochrome c family protein
MPAKRAKKTLRRRVDHGDQGLPMHCNLTTRSLAGALIASAALAPAAHASTPAQLLSDYSEQAGSVAVPERGRQLFTTRHGREWSCASCHGAVPTQAGKHAATGKPIGPLAPAFTPERFTDPGKADKWFRRNCNDVVGRECTAAEKADVLSWLLTLKP